jgi:hypothetical protein
MTAEFSSVRVECETIADSCESFRSVPLGNSTLKTYEVDVFSNTVDGVSTGKTINVEVCDTVETG